MIRRLRRRTGKKRYGSLHNLFLMIHAMQLFHLPMYQTCYSTDVVLQLALYLNLRGGKRNNNCWLSIPLQLVWPCCTMHQCHQTFLSLQVPAPAYTLWRGPQAYPRARTAYRVQRDPSDIDKFATDHGGGEGVAALLEAREKAEESFGYDWVHTVLTSDGRPFPWLPIIIVASWTMLVLIVFMLACRFDRLILEDYGYSGPATAGITEWQRTLFLYMRGLEVRVIYANGACVDTCIEILEHLNEHACLQICPCLRV